MNAAFEDPHSLSTPYTRMLKDLRVEVNFINDGIKTFDGDGELRLTIMATLAQDESRKTSIRVKSGQQTSMDNGVYYGNGNILGYDRYEELLPDKTKLVEFHINPEQAKTVRLIFDMYLDGCGLVKIKDELERRGYKTSQGKEKWFPTVISHVLKNTFYSICENGTDQTGRCRIPISVTVLSAPAPTKAERRRGFLWKVSARLP